MSLTYSSIMPLGTHAPDFHLVDVISGKEISPGMQKKEHGLVVMFICNHCPYVLHIEDEVSRVAREYQEKGVGFVAISSNDIDKYPDDDPEGMREQAKRAGFTFPYIYDESQEVAKAYEAECTPEFYVFNASLECVYRGRLDAASPGNGKPIDGADLRRALDNLISGRNIPLDQKPSMGCNIKWKA
ncbi:MAG: thioredoxin family protein [Bacteroidota bacterium]